MVFTIFLPAAYRAWKWKLGDQQDNSEERETLSVTAPRTRDYTAQKPEKPDAFLPFLYSFTFSKVKKLDIFAE